MWWPSSLPLLAILSVSLAAPLLGATFQCGKPNSLCGSSIPSGIKCPKGAGYCDKGYYCSYGTTTTNPSRCLPVPKNCGKPGFPCCPSNVDKPHTTEIDIFTRKPSCQPGSYCLYFAPRAVGNADFYAGIQGYQPCQAVPKDCGAVGKACCPNVYHQTVNPPAFWTDICKTNNWCEYNIQGKGKNVCRANAADCGQFGKSCCVYTGSAASSFTCGPPGKGYCAGPKGEQWNKGISWSQLVCKSCPADWKKNPEYYFGCN